MGLFFTAAAAAFAFVGTSAATVNLSGTIRYTGSGGPASVTQPIRLQVFADPNFQGDSVARAIVTTSPGDFVIQLPTPGLYYLAYWLDLNNDGRANVGEAVEIYNDKLSFPADPIDVPASGVSGLNLDFGDTRAPGIRGSATYTGEIGEISDQLPIVVQAFTDAGLTNADQMNGPQSVRINGGRYEILTLDNQPRFLRAFVDLNGNNQFDSGEPFEIYDKRGATPGDSAVGSADPADINLVFGDQPPQQRLTGTVRYMGSRASVSPARPIVVSLFSLRSGDTEVDRAIVSNSGDAFTLGAPAAGNYFVACGVDTVGDGNVHVGSPVTFYNGRTSFSNADAVAVPGSGLAITFGDDVLLQGIGGRVRYFSDHSVSSQNPVIVELFSDPLLQSQVGENDLSQSDARSDFITLDTNTYYLRACYDENGNGRCDSGEPLEVYNNKGSGEGADPIVAGGNQGAITIEFSDQPPVAHLSGTVTYTGQQGPVSSVKPINVLFTGNGRPDATTLATSPGAFDLDVAAPGDYSFAYFLDVNNDGQPNIGEPFAIYNNCFQPPCGTISVPSSGVNVMFDDTGRLPGIGGTIVYRGHQGSVSATTPLVVQAFTDPSFAGDEQDAAVNVDGGRYDIITAGNGPGPYYLRAFLDLNDNGNLDPGEPFDIFNGKAVGQAPDPLAASSAQSAVNILVTDDNLSPPAVCVGDCDGHGNVSVSDTIALVRIALGAAQPSACEQGVPNGLAVNVVLIIQAVNNGVNACSG